MSLPLPVRLSEGGRVRSLRRCATPIGRQAQQGRVFARRTGGWAAIGTTRLPPGARGAQCQAFPRARRSRYPGMRTALSRRQNATRTLCVRAVGNAGRTRRTLDMRSGAVRHARHPRRAVRDSPEGRCARRWRRAAVRPPRPISLKNSGIPSIL